MFKTEIAYFAGGCFWGVEYYFLKLPGVINTIVGYMGGEVNNPTYQQICTGQTGHAETMRVDFNPQEVSFKTLAKLFFEIHDPTQKNRQGPDVGPEYRSVVFYTSEEQKQITEELIDILKAKNLDVQTEVIKASTFWPAEEYHQQYYQKNSQEPYCHIRKKIF